MLFVTILLTQHLSQSVKMVECLWYTITFTFHIDPPNFIHQSLSQVVTTILRNDQYINKWQDPWVPKPY